MKSQQQFPGAIKRQGVKKNIEKNLANLELRFTAAPNPARGVSETCDSENLGSGW